MSLIPEDILTGPDLMAWIEYCHYLKGANRSPRTIQSYGEAVAQLARRIAPATVLGASRADVTGYLIWCREEHSAATALNRFRSLRAAYGWLEREEIIARSPMLRVPPPGKEQRVPRVLADGDLSALLAACAARRDAGASARLAALRDRAVIAIWCEAGSPRVSEMAAVTLQDLDVRAGTLLVHGKGRKDRLVPLSHETVRDILRYLRARAADPRAAHTAAAWLGRQPVFGARGLAQMLSERARAAGLGHVHPHAMRHTAYDRFRRAGGSIDDAMALFGWSDLTMALLYGRAAPASRSVEAGRRIALRSGL